MNNIKLAFIFEFLYYINTENNKTILYTIINIVYKIMSFKLNELDLYVYTVYIYTYIDNICIIYI